MNASWLWLGFIPLLYLPNFIRADTGVGKLETADFLIVPLFIIVLLLPRKASKNTYSRFLVVPGLGFLLWCLLGVLMIYLLYELQNVDKVVAFSLLKVGKFALYTVLPLSLSKRLVNARVREDYMWALATCGLVVGIGVLFNSVLFTGTTSKEKLVAFKALNLVSVAMAILLTYLVAYYLAGGGSRHWRNYCRVALCFLGFGFTYTEGRGGWVAALVGLTYMAYKQGLLRKRTLSILTALTGVAIFLYFFNLDFQREVTRTLFPESAYGAEYNILPIDDGYRLHELNSAFRNFSANIILGSGFYHRGFEVGLYQTSSHNFWIQMLFETGIVGFLFIFTIFTRIWRQAKSPPAVDEKYSLATRTALVTAFVGGLSGDYFYGGLALLSVMLCYVPLGSLNPVRMELRPREIVDQNPANGNLPKNIASFQIPAHVENRTT